MSYQPDNPNLIDPPDELFDDEEPTTKCCQAKVLSIKGGYVCEYCKQPVNEDGEIITEQEDKK